MSRVNEIINKRHTTRLMDDTISQEHVDKIIDSARRAPSKNRIYGYSILALTNSEQGQMLKQRLCDHVTKYEDEGQLVYLRQTTAPLVLIYVANPAPEHQMLVSTENKLDGNLYDKSFDDVKNERDRAMMIKNSIRDAMISATYANLTAEDLGLGSAFVACGLEDLMWDTEFEKLFKLQFGDDFHNRPIEPVIIMCFGPKHERIKRLYAGDSDVRQEPYLNGVTHYIRSGREQSFVVNEKQQRLVTTI